MVSHEKLSESSVSIKKRYHVHICLVRNEQPEIEDALQVALSEDYFLTWDLIVPPTTSAEFTRHQIDICDYLIFLIGDSYGTLSPSGVSFLHLNYIYAATKRIPMLALIKTQTGQKVQARQRQELVSLIEKEQLDNVLTYKDVTSFKQNCSLANLVKNNPKVGWQKFRKISNLSSSASTSNNDGFVLAKPKPMIDIETEKMNGFNPLLIPKEVVKPLTIPNLEKVSKNDIVWVNYSAHAYQGGNLKDINATYGFTWQEIIDMLAKLTKPFSTELMQKTLNDSLKQPALEEAQKSMLNVHAVSRCLINAMDFQIIKQQLISNGWIVGSRDERTNREAWEVA